MANKKSKERFVDLDQSSKTNGDLDKIINSNTDKEIVVICGSFFIMKDVRRFFGFKDECDPYELNERFIPGFKH